MIVDSRLFGDCVVYSAGHKNNRTLLAFMFSLPGCIELHNLMSAGETDCCY